MLAINNNNFVNTTFCYASILNRVSSILFYSRAFQLCASLSSRVKYFSNSRIRACQSRRFCVPATADRKYRENDGPWKIERETFNGFLCKIVVMHFCSMIAIREITIFFALLALRALLSNNRRGESDFGELSGANFIIPEYGYIIWKARVLYPKQSTSMHTRDATSCARICRLIALVIRARLGKARHKWKFRGIAVHTRCFIPR